MSFCLSSSLHPFGPVPGSVWSEIQKPGDQGESFHSYLLLETVAAKKLSWFLILSLMISSRHGAVFVSRMGASGPPSTLDGTIQFSSPSFPRPSKVSTSSCNVDVPDLPLTQSPTQMTLSTRENRTRQEATPTS